MYHDTRMPWPGAERMVKTPAADPILAELIAVLAPNPGGLRRWSVMRAIRKNREKLARDIPLKLEADVERIFRQYCSGPADAGMRTVAADKAVFCRPAEKAGEVWALHPDYARKANETQTAPAPEQA